MLITPEIMRAVERRYDWMVWRARLWYMAKIVLAGALLGVIVFGALLAVVERLP